MLDNITKFNFAVAISLIDWIERNRTNTSRYVSATKYKGKFNNSFMSLSDDELLTTFNNSINKLILTYPYMATDKDCTKKTKIIYGRQYDEWTSAGMPPPLYDYILSINADTPLSTETTQQQDTIFRGGEDEDE